MTKLANLKPSKNQSRGRRRVGRGNGSGMGTFSGKGCKGQTARSGGRRRPGFEGGQTPLYRKMPKLKGFRNINRIEFFAINLDTLEAKFSKGKVTKQDLIDANIIRKADYVKLLGRGTLTKALEVEVDRASASAIAAVKKAGGKVTELLPRKEKTQSEAKGPKAEAKAEAAPSEPEASEENENE